ncbi:hypothetical protein EJ04DRAFT_512320 [Polyplosphaeria fusca]|uniref:Uncharacterized protein n=1 Tax=Polyplosphaeria fusca TaxID=682080 RepID=A0A9P4V3S3_9PLEO|nr:hypothetical protein EJ04DRAFT_512320 [Polyplosphaeria fusca]
MYSQAGSTPANRDPVSMDSTPWAAVPRNTPGSTFFNGREGQMLAFRGLWSSGGVAQACALYADRHGIVPKMDAWPAHHRHKSHARLEAGSRRGQAADAYRRVLWACGRIDVTCDRGPTWVFQKKDGHEEDGGVAAMLDKGGAKAAGATCEAGAHPLAGRFVLSGRTGDQVATVKFGDASVAQ